LSGQKKQIEIRVPLIPGYNDSVDNIKEMGKFIKELGGKVNVQLLPYHHYAVSKYKRLGMKYKIKEIKFEHIQKSVDRAYKILKGMGVNPNNL
jgi:pyruvate formate lyase activating enzyme